MHFLNWFHRFGNCPTNILHTKHIVIFFKIWCTVTGVVKISSVSTNCSIKVFLAIILQIIIIQWYSIATLTFTANNCVLAWLLLATSIDWYTEHCYIYSGQYSEYFLNHCCQCTLCRRLFFCWSIKDGGERNTEISRNLNIFFFVICSPHHNSKNKSLLLKCLQI